VTDNAYSFLPWLRTGLATKIGESPVVKQRATVPVKLVLSAEPVDGVDKVEPRTVGHDVQLYGPGDVIGIDPRAVSRTEPRDWITAFEPNYLAHIEFYHEDFPWRYSPAPQDAGRRVTPWLALIVLAASKEPQRGTPAPGDEFADGDQPGPLPYITIGDPAGTLQPPAELAAWAHVHVNGPLAGSVTADLDGDGQGPALDTFAAVLAANPDNACSRIVCPRHLRPRTGYHAFLVPAFESGRLAGLGEKIPDTLSATQPGWGPGTTSARSGQMPYYHRWYFATGDAGDFAHLVRLLKPRQADDNIARRDIDVHYSPGFKLPAIDDPKTKGILKLGGALRPDRAADDWDNWDLPPVTTSFPHPFQTALAKLVNLADDYLTTPPAAANTAALRPDGLPVPVDPIITPPLYGRWPALNSRLLTDRDGTDLVPDPHHRPWVQQLNLDPRHRVAANFAEQIFQARQEEFMTAAWEQVGDVVRANAKIRAAQLQCEVGRRLHEKHVAEPVTTPAGRALTLTAPVHPRVTRDDLEDPEQQVAVGYQVATSRVRAAAVSATMRRVARPGSRLMKALPFREPQDRHQLPERLDADPAHGGVTAAARKIRADAVVTEAWVTGQVTALAGHTPPPGRPAPPPPGTPAPQSPSGTLPDNPGFVLSTDIHAPAPPSTTPTGDAQNFKQALDALYDGWQGSFAAGPTRAVPTLGVARVTGHTLERLKSDSTVPASVSGTVDVPSRLGGQQPDTVLEVMAYPRIDLPMYEALRDTSVEEFVPNLGLVPPNTITLLLTDHAFIESFMVGLNHAMARELLWREYPTDQRGTPFRQFWDTHTVLPLPGESADARRERLYDIKPIDKWRDEHGRFTELGRNGNRPVDVSQDPADPRRQENLVLVVRGELLKKYPTAVVYAQQAAWKTGPDGKPDYRQKRLLREPPDPNHPEPIIRQPIYGAKVEPDLYLLGFALTEDEARGFREDLSPVGDGAGWYFVIKERPGDPRFGAEDDQLPDLTLWDDISWPDVDPSPSRGFVEIDAAPEVKLAGLPLDDANPAQRQEDLAMPQWSGSLSSADIAYILFRVPVLMAVHAQEMLPHDRRVH
jgi:hypothetical protein